ncbi:unnamed protein product [Diamesa hyperborea]
MKFLAIFLVAFVCCSANAQLNETTSDNLLKAQDELSLTHEFAEFVLSSSRDQLSATINRMIGELIQSFLDSYDSMKVIADETNEIFENLESGFCAERFRNRWNLQRMRYGNRLSECLLVSHNVMNEISSQLNTIHAIAHRTSNQIQNAGLHILSQLDSFHTRQDFESLINRQLRILLTMVRPYRTQFENFVSDVSTNTERTVRDLTDCERSLIIAFRAEAVDDVAGAEACFSD